MTEVLVKALVVVRKHPGGSVSAHPAPVTAFVAHGADRDAALGELGLFLASHLAKVGAEAVQQLVLPEEPELQHFEIVVPNRGRATMQRLKSPIALAALVVPAERGARWVLVPALNHVCYVPQERLEETPALVAREIERLLYASDLDGGALLDLLPPLETVVERLEVELERPVEKESLPAGKARAEARKRKEAHALLESSGRRLKPATTALLHREAQAKTLRTLLEGETRASVVLIGPEGAGKSALVQAAFGSGADALQRPIYVTSGAELVAGQSFLGQLEERVQSVLAAAELVDAVLYFEALDDLFAGRSGGYQDLASSMRRHVMEGRVRVLGELTPERHDRLQYQNVGFFSYLQRVAVEPLTRGQTLDVLEARSSAARRRERPSLTREANAALLELVERYYPHVARPGGAVRLAEELTTLHAGEIVPDDVYRVTSARTGVPEFLLRDERALKLDEVVRHFEGQLIGQREAIRQVSEVLCRVKAGLAPTNKPLATFLFVGPTGVGKTELAKALARYLFGSAERLARFDMSEFRGPLAAERLIRGSDSGDGLLTRRIRQQPFTVLLLDEIEKADSSVFDLLLQVAGEGRLSDAQGKVASFNNAIIIMTSNLGAMHQGAAPGFGSQATVGREHYLQQVREHFRPEFINRLDRIVAFEPMTLEQMREVTELSIERLRRREGLDQRNVELLLSPGAALKLAEDGYSRAYGARGLRRHLEHALVAPLAGVLAGLGKRASGTAISVRLSGEEARGSGPELAREQRGGIDIVAHGRPDPEKQNAGGALEIARLRRQVTRCERLDPLSELRERIRELTAELSSEDRWKREGKALGQIYGELLAEHARLTGLVQPLDEARRELEAIEAMVVGSLDEGGASDLFASDAAAAHERYKERFIPAALAQNTDKEISLVLHELDDARVLNRFLPQLLRYLDQTRWRVLLHVDRDEEADRDPTRRWGTPHSPEDYRKRYGALEPPGRRFKNVLVRVSGHAAGAILSFLVGRWRYPLKPQGHGELWVRLGAPAFEHFERIDSAIDTAVGRKQPLRADVEDADLLERWDSVIFDWVVDKIRSGAAFLPDGERYAAVQAQRARRSP
jgi:ATP-dependent Clp protease ATP-binding subunit ClpC